MPTKPIPFKTPLPILQKIEHCRLTQEKRLDLSGGTNFGQFLLPFVPPEVFTLTHLEELDLRKNGIQVLPEEIHQLKNLKKIDLRYNPLRQVADVLGLFLHYADVKRLKLSPENIIGLKLTLFSYDAPEGILAFPNLTALDISHHRLKQIPDWVGKLEKLTTLDLSGNPLTGLDGLAPLVNLTTLDLSGNQLTRLDGLVPLVNLTTLDLRDNQLTHLDGLAPLVNLTTLDLHGNQLTRLDGLVPLVNLTTLDLSGNQLIHLDGLAPLVNLTTFLDLRDNQLTHLDGLAPLINLTALDLSWNQLTGLDGLAPLVNLTTLDLSGNQLTGLDGLAPLVNLTTLDLSGNQLTGLSGLAPLVNLTTLDLRDNQLTLLDGLAPLVNLTTLYLTGNQLTGLSGLAPLVNLTTLDLRDNQTHLDGLVPLINLTALDLSRNHLTHPDHLAPLINLTALALSENQLTDLDGLAPLVNLTTLDLSENQLTGLDGLAPLVNLTSLYLSGNQLTDLDGLAPLVNLTTLDLSRNQSISRLPETLLALPKLERLRLDENLVTEPPIEQLELKNGYANLLRVRNYLRQLAEDKDYLYEAKLLIVGEGGAGKTSLARKIQNPNYPLTKNGIDSTEGIDVIRWQFPFNIEHSYRVNIWDFGGQEIYHATHQFFLTKRALYLLVADNRKEDTDFYYWLSIVELLSDNSPLLIVKNEKDDRTREINETALKGQFNNLKEIYATNLLSNSKDYPRLLADLPHRLKQLPHIGTALPKRWLKVRTALEKEPGNYIHLEKFLALCDQYGFEKREDKLQLSETLHDLGSILHFQQDPLLNRTIFLKPHWATQAVYHVLDNKMVQQNFGKFTQTDLAKIWHEPEYDFMHDELLQLMLKFKLCYPLKHCQDTYIAPQLLTEAQPNYSWDAQDNLLVFYKNYEFMPKGILTQLIVALHQDIADQQHRVWRSGVVLEKDHTQAEIIENYGKRELQIRVAGQHKRDRMTIIMHELQQIHDSYHKRLKYDVLLPCHCEKFRKDPEFFKYAELRYFADHKEPIQCRKCFNKLNAMELLNGVLDVNKVEETKGGEKGDTYHIYNPGHVEITHKEEVEMKPEKPIKSSWANGSFYLVAVVLISLIYGYIAKDVPFYALIIVLISGILLTLLVGILQLRQDENLKEKSFIELVRLIVNQLPLLRGIFKDGVNRNK